MEDPLENQNENKKHCSEEEIPKNRGLLILTLTVCTKSYLSIITEPWMQSITITLDMKASSFTSKAGMTQSPVRMES